VNVFPYKILFVDLSSQKVWDEEISREDLEKYAGSRGITPLGFDR